MSEVRFDPRDIRRGRQNKTVIVVGSGRSVLGSGMGPLIDAFDEVARFVWYRTVGYERDVGRRTTVVFASERKPPSVGPTIMHMPKGWDKTETRDVRRIYVPYHASFRRKTIERIKKLYGRVRWGPAGVRPVIAPLKTTPLLVKKYRLKEKYPSIGLQALVFMAQTYGVVYYFGFDFYLADHGHYYEEKVKKDTCHNMSDEARVINDMEREGTLIKLQCVVDKGLCRKENQIRPQPLPYRPGCRIVGEYRVDIKDRARFLAQGGPGGR
eukprot:jgi/Mesvir1/24543/Mv21881-RA.1